MLVDSGTTLLGLVQHLATGERYWFGHHLTGSHAGTDWDFTMDVSAGRSPDGVLADYRDAIAGSDAAIAAAGGPDALAVEPVDGEHAHAALGDRAHDR